VSNSRKNPDLFGGSVVKWGSVWDKNSEIDIIGLNEKDEIQIIGECKYSAKKVGSNVLEELKSKSTRLNNLAEDNRYILFSKSGFTDDLIKKAESYNIRFFDLSFKPYLSE